MSAAAVIAGIISACGGSGGGPIAGTPSPSPSATASTIARQLFDRLGSGDAGAASALVSDDATWDGGPGCSPVKCAGALSIQKAFAARVASHPRYTASDFVESGSTVTFRLEVASDRITAAGAQRVLVKEVFTARGGKVSAVTETFDTSDPATATYVKFLQAHPAAPPSPTP